VPVIINKKELDSQSITNNLIYDFQDIIIYFVKKIIIIYD